MQKGDGFTELLKGMIMETFNRISKPIETLQYLTVTQISQCPRRTWYQLKKGGLDLASEYADIGIAFHQLIQNAIQTNNELGICNKEVEIAKQIYGIEIRGRMDMVCLSKNKYRIIEFKTTNLRDGFKGIEENHLRQVSLYWHLADAQSPTKELYLVYVDRKTGETKVIKMGYKNMLKRTQLSARIKYIIKSFETNKLAKAEPGKWCGFCPYKGVCKAWKR